MKLLERIDEFAGHLRPQVVNDKIYGFFTWIFPLNPSIFWLIFFRNLVTGFMDSNSAVRESTVKAMVSFADKLNYHNLNTDLMKYLARLQGSDPEPSIRTNSTIVRFFPYFQPNFFKFSVWAKSAATSIPAIASASWSPPSQERWRTHSHQPEWPGSLWANFRIIFHFLRIFFANFKALSATQQYYSLAEVAQRVLPALVPLAVDPEKQVAFW